MHITFNPLSDYVPCNVRLLMLCLQLCMRVFV